MIAHKSTKVEVLYVHAPLDYMQNVRFYSYILTYMIVCLLG